MENKTTEIKPLIIEQVPIYVSKGEPGKDGSNALISEPSWQRTAVKDGIPYKINSGWAVLRTLNNLYQNIYFYDENFEYVKNSKDILGSSIYITFTPENINTIKGLFYFVDYDSLYIINEDLTYNKYTSLSNNIYKIDDELYYTKNKKLYRFDIETRKSIECCSTVYPTTSSEFSLSTLFNTVNENIIKTKKYLIYGLTNYKHIVLFDRIEKTLKFVNTNVSDSLYFRPNNKNKILFSYGGTTNYALYELNLEKLEITKSTFTQPSLYFNSVYYNDDNTVDYLTEKTFSDNEGNLYNIQNGQPFINIYNPKIKQFEIFSEVLNVNKLNGYSNAHQLYIPSTDMQNNLSISGFIVDLENEKVIFQTNFGQASSLINDAYKQQYSTQIFEFDINTKKTYKYPFGVGRVDTSGFGLCYENFIRKIKIEDKNYITNGYILYQSVEGNLSTELQNFIEMGVIPSYDDVDAMIKKASSSSSSSYKSQGMIYDLYSFNINEFNACVLQDYQYNLDLESSIPYSSEEKQVFVSCKLSNNCTLILPGGEIMTFNNSGAININFTITYCNGEKYVSIIKYKEM